MAHRIYKYIFNPLLFFCRRLLLMKANKYIEMIRYPFSFSIYSAFFNEDIALRCVIRKGDIRKRSIRN